MLRVLVIGMFCVTRVSMQTAIGRQTAASGTLESAQYPDTGAFDFAWEITVDQNHQILLQFLDFSLNETTSCSIDVLELYDGGRFDNVLIDRFCWDNATALASTAYVSTGNQLYLRLITVEGYSRKGFRAHYISVDLQHTNSSGEVTSPGYPDTGHPLDEAWRIKVNEGYQIRLEFLDFALHMSLPCVNDYFEIYDGACNRYYILERWCWDSFSELPQTVYISTGNTLYLRLRTMHGFSRKGFNTSYTSVTTQTVVRNNFLSVTETSNLNRKSTSSTIPLTENGTIKPSVNSLGFVVGILAVVVFTVFVIAIIVWKFKIKKEKSSPSTGHGIQSQLAPNPGTYEEVTIQKDSINRDSLETSHERKFVVNVSANVTTSYVEPGCAYSKQIVPQTSERKADTPDDSYETPDVNLYSYANPNELR